MGQPKSCLHCSDASFIPVLRNMFISSLRLQTLHSSVVRYASTFLARSVTVSPLQKSQQNAPYQLTEWLLVLKVTLLRHKGFEINAM
jgi:hypothetical protein